MTPATLPRKGAGDGPPDRVRWRVLRGLERHLELPMAFLGLVWLGLFVFEVVHGTDPVTAGIGIVIWIAFLADYVVRLLLAPRRWEYVRRSWLTAISLVVPALRALRIAPALRVLGAARAARGARLVRTVASLNRGLRALSTSLRRRGVGYVALATVAVAFAGAAGMYALEAGAPGFADYGDALWWTATLLTTLGATSGPLTAEGRVLAFLLSLYAIGVFGFVTATLASFFVGRDAASGQSDLPSGADVRAVRRELAALRRELLAGRSDPARS